MPTLGFEPEFVRITTLVPEMVCSQVCGFSPVTMVSPHNKNAENTWCQREAYLVRSYDLYRRYTVK